MNILRTFTWDKVIHCGIEIDEDELEEFFEDNDDCFYESHPRELARVFVVDWTDYNWKDIPYETAHIMENFFEEKYIEWLKRQAQKHIEPRQLSMFDNEI